jgi:TonB family protein
MIQSNIKTAFTISFLLHLGIFAAFSIKSQNAVYISIPVEMFYYSTPVPRESTQAQPAAPEAKKEKKQELVIPKKHKTADKIPAKKEKIEQEKPKVQETQAAPAQKSISPLVPSSQITLDTAKFPYTYYTSMIVKKISRNWQWSVDFGQLKAVVYFKIQKDGSVSALSIKDSSGDSAFDQQAMRAVEIAAPFPPLPAGYTENDLGVYFEFSFKE